MAIELELNQAPPPGCPEREALNRTRTWLNCYCVDGPHARLLAYSLIMINISGSHAIQFGKMPMLRLDDYLARNSHQWYKSPMNSHFDVHLCAYVQLIILMAQWRSISGDGHALRQKYREVSTVFLFLLVGKLTSIIHEKGFDVPAAAIAMSDKLQQELNLWVGRYAEEYAYKRNNLSLRILVLNHSETPLSPALLICAYRGNTTQMYFIPFMSF